MNAAGDARNDTNTTLAASAEKPIAAPRIAEPSGQAPPAPVRPRIQLNWNWLVPLLFVLLLLLLLLLRFLWGWEAQRRLDQQLAAYHAAGQPAFMEHFQPPDVADEDNAAPLWEQAHNATKFRFEYEGHDIDDLMSSAYAADYPEALAGFVAANGEALALMKQAAAKAGADWGLRYTSPVVDMLAPHLSIQQGNAKLMSIAARDAACLGDSALALRRIEQMLQAAEHMKRYPAHNLTHLNINAIHLYACACIEDLLPTLQISSVPSAPGAAARSDAALLMRRLLEDGELWEQLRYSLYAERMLFLDMIACTCNGSPRSAGAGPMSTGARVHFFLFRPRYMLDGLYGIRWTTELADAAMEKSWPAFKMVAPAPPQGDSRHFLSGLFLPLLENTIQHHYRTIARRRMAGLALALRLYEIDHGQLPGALDALVPGYLATLPADPFRPAGQTFGYLPHADEPRLYTIGVDGIDDGGVYEIKRGKFDRDEDSIDLESRDPPFFLTRARPYLKPRSPLGVRRSDMRNAPQPPPASSQPAASAPAPTGSPPP